MQDALDAEIKPGCAQELITQCKDTLVIICDVILHLLKGDTTLEAGVKTDQQQAREIFKEVWIKCPQITCPFTKYKAPLCHVFFYKRIKPYKFGRSCDECCLELMKMVVDEITNLDVQDSEGNTLLHVVVHAIPYNPQTTQEIVELLIQNGIHIHARNNQRMTALDILKDLDPDDYQRMQDVEDLISKSEEFHR
jgi:hypothetical protein